MVIAAVGAVLGIGMAAAVASHAPPVYEAEATMKVPSPRRVCLSACGKCMWSTSEDLLLDRRVLARAIADLELDKQWNVTPPEAREMLKQQLEIGPATNRPPAIIGRCREWADRAGIPAGALVRQVLDKLDSAICPHAPANDTVTIRAKSDDRLLSADLANGVANAYLKFWSELIEEQDQQALGVLDGQIQEQKERLRAAKEKMLESKRLLSEEVARDDP